MAKRSPNYILVLLMLVAATAITYKFHFMPQERLHDPDLKSFPLNIDNWSGRDQELADAVQEGIEADDYLWRVYLDDDELNYLGLLVVYRKYGRRGFVHRPEMCYPAAGWTLSDKEYVTIPYAGGETRALKLLATRTTTSGETEKELLLYWFVSGERMEASYVKQQILMAADRLQTNKYGWAFIRINVPIPYSEQESLEYARRFLAKGADRLNEALLRPRQTHASAGPN